MISTEAIEVRKFNPESDEAFVYSTWLKNYKHSSYFAKRIRPMVFFKGHRVLVDHLLKKESAKTLVAHPKNDPDTILGYLTFEPQVVHFVFVKDPFRKMGIATVLLRAAQIELETATFTHWTFPVDEFVRRWPGMTYDPYKL